MLFALAFAANVSIYDRHLSASYNKRGTKVQPRLRTICSASTASMWAVLAWTSVFLFLRFAWSENILTPLAELPTVGVSERFVVWIGVCGAGALANVAISTWPLLAACTRRRRVGLADVVSIVVAMCCGAYPCWQSVGHALPFLFE